jgi:outer membrane protein TolC
VLSDPTSALAAALTLPFLQANEMLLSTQISAAQYEEARLVFRQTLWRALSEVENALSARTQLAAQGVELEASLAAAATAERLYEARYRAGAASLRDWLDAPPAGGARARTEPLRPAGGPGVALLVLGGAPGSSRHAP